MRRRPWSRPRRPERVRVAQGNAAHRGDRVTVAIRPEKIAIARAGGAPPAPTIRPSGVLLEIGYFGDISVYKVKLDGSGTMRVAAANVTPRRCAGRANRASA